jgi:hypothetical protein
MDYGIGEQNTGNRIASHSNEIKKALELKKTQALQASSRNASHRNKIKTLQNRRSHNLCREMHVTARSTK